MSEAFAAAIRRRADEAADALHAAEREGDPDAALAAAGALDEVLRMARAHGVSTDRSGRPAQAGDVLDGKTAP
ncbi:hypothetical protein HCN51_47460 [Nonomuraea sp. FMUSA5-5]|uniref:Uncharacterized protein n=1 Tax=Nonomuraea composti TaxID=2720023 RepID=A0ABX1BNY5_9ACTN|nr:hypothetical protein [Nonomuraea sp. FMUSA5-5]NJP96981.1 hypothetical protein [Nonomuraea sp. FMUSA5-5]